MVNSATCEPNKLFPGPEADVDLPLKLDLCARKLKFRALFAKNGGGEEVPLKLLNQFWSSYSSGMGGGGVDPNPGGPGGNKFPSPPGLGWNKLAPVLSLLLLLFFLFGLFISLNLPRRFFISNSFPGWLGKDFIKSLSVCFLFQSIFLSSDPTMGFSTSNVKTSSKTSSKGF